jgi:mRNA-degrading endonuclease RelE of RelBE toxin-antitoxin system
MRLWIDRPVVDEIADLPGNIRQRMRRAIGSLPQDPRPDQSKALDIPEDLREPHLEARRLRMDQWRIIYVIDDDLEQINILAVRRRPPYDYADLAELLGS